MRITFTIEVPPRTKKNSGRIVRRGRKLKLLPSEAYETYERDSLLLLPGKIRRLGICEPVNVKATYFTDAARRVDLNGLNQALHDMLVKAGTLADDSALNPPIVVGTDGTRVEVDRKRPRTEVEITSVVPAGRPITAATVAGLKEAGRNLLETEKGYAE